MSQIPATMPAIKIAAPGGPEVLVATEAPVPRPNSGELLIKVAAAGVNRPDVLQRKGLYPAPKGHFDLPGLEVSGTVVATGESCKRFKTGDQVMALVNGGGYAAYAIADEGVTLPIPAGTSLIEAAAMPEALYTVWHNVFERGGLKSGERFLVHGGTSGIGVTAIQLAKAFGAHVTATAGSDQKCAACLELGADRAVNYATEDFAAVIKTDTAGKGVDVILDMVGGDYIDKNIRSLADDGRLVNIAFQKGSTATLDLMRVMLKRLTITGSTLRIRTPQVKAQIAKAVEDNVIPLVTAGKVKVLIDSTFALSEASKAHARMEGSQHIGKIVLTVA